MSRGRAEREGDTEPEAGSKLWDPDVRLKLTNYQIMTWAEVGRSTDWATQEPLLVDTIKQLFQYCNLITTTKHTLKLSDQALDFIC